MTDSTSGQETNSEVVDQQEGAGTSAGTQNTDTPDTIPYQRFKEVNDRNKQLAERLEALERERDAQTQEAERERQRQMKDQEKYKELASELEQKVADLEPRLAETQARLQRLEGILDAHATAQMKLVPEVYHSVINKLPVEERLEWFTANRELLEPTTTTEGSGPKGIPATPKGRGTAKLSDEDRRQRAARTF